jgi:hypothetical protein
VFRPHLASFSVFLCFAVIALRSAWQPVRGGSINCPVISPASPFLVGRETVVKTHTIANQFPIRLLYSGPAAVCCEGLITPPRYPPRRKTCCKPAAASCRVGLGSGGSASSGRTADRKCPSIEQHHYRHWCPSPASPLCTYSQVVKTAPKEQTLRAISICNTQAPTLTFPQWKAE